MRDILYVIVGNLELHFFCKGYKYYQPTKRMALNTVWEQSTYREEHVTGGKEKYLCRR